MDSFRKARSFQDLKNNIGKKAKILGVSGPVGVDIQLDGVLSKPEPSKEYPKGTIKLNDDVYIKPTWTPDDNDIFIMKTNNHGNSPY